MADTPVAPGATLPAKDRTAFNSDKQSDRPTVDKNQYRVAEVRDDGTAVLRMEDGRMFVATIGDGQELNKRSVVTVSYDKTDGSGAPIDARVQSVVS